MPFRKATQNDVAEIQRIAQEVIRHNYTPFLGADATASFIESGQSDREIEDGIGSCVLLEKDGEIAAFAITKGNLLHLIMVAVPFQNAGYGEMLLSHVEVELFRQHERICLQTFGENIRAARFYEKHGWQIAGKTDVPEMGVTMVQYEKVQNSR